MNPAVSGLLADLVMVVHLGFVIFVVAGALLVVWRPRAAWLHLPCALYGAAIELFGWVCPLTPWEQSLRRAAGQAGYVGGFSEHYVGRILYPGNWGDIHVMLGVGVLALNVALYGWLLWRRGRRKNGRRV
jgi:hypothetical protein